MPSNKQNYSKKLVKNNEKIVKLWRILRNKTMDNKKFHEKYQKIKKTKNLNQILV